MSRDAGALVAQRRRLDKNWLTEHGGEAAIKPAEKMTDTPAGIPVTYDWRRRPLVA